MSISTIFQAYNKGDHMKKIAISIIAISILFIACLSIFPRNSSITLKQVVSALENQDLELKKAKVDKNDVFGKKLNGIRPTVYKLKGKSLFVYIYSSPDARKNGLKDFFKKTENTNIVSFKQYEMENVLLFYVYEEDLSKGVDLELDSKIENALNKLEQNS